MVWQAVNTGPAVTHQSGATDNLAADNQQTKYSRMLTVSATRTEVLPGQSNPKGRLPEEVDIGPTPPKPFPIAYTVPDTRGCP